MIGRVSVGGHSMEPTLRHGDRLLYARLPLRAGDVAVARLAGIAGSWVVKRVARVSDGGVVLTSDAAAHAELTVTGDSIVGRVLLRYAPVARARLF